MTVEKRNCIRKPRAIRMHLHAALMRSRRSRGAFANVRCTVERFVERHRTWIERKREEARARALPAAPFPPREIDFAACDERWQIHVTGSGRRVRLSALGNGLLVLDGDVSDASAVRLVLRRWLTERATEVLPPHSEAMCLGVGLRLRARSDPSSAQPLGGVARPAVRSVSIAA